MKKFILGFVVALVLCGIVIGAYMLGTKNATHNGDVPKENNTEIVNPNDEQNNNNEKQEIINTDNDVVSKEKLIEMLNDIEKDEGWIVRESEIIDIKKEQNSKYLATICFYDPILINKDEFNKLIEEGYIYIENKRYELVEKEEPLDDLEITGYKVNVEGDSEYIDYYIIETNGGYGFWIEIGGAVKIVRKPIKTIKYYFEEETKVYVPGSEDIIKNVNINKMVDVNHLSPRIRNSEIVLVAQTW